MPDPTPRSRTLSRDAIRTARAVRAVLVALLLAALPVVAAACNKGGSSGY